LAIVLPFPRVKDRAFVRRHAERMVCLSHYAAERHLSAQLHLQRATMLKRGINPALAEEQVRSLESAIRAHVWHATFQPGGVA
jgi:hypothetical protein